MTKKAKSTKSDTSGEYRSIAVLDRIMATVKPFIWVRDANISNVANGGYAQEIQMYIVDTAWITSTEYGPQFQHRYEIGFFEGGSLRANIAVTFGLLFDPFDEDPDLQAEYFQLESGSTGQIDLFRKSGLYEHSWPHLQEFVKQTIAAFGWSAVELPEHFEPTSTPISSAYVQGLTY